MARDLGFHVPPEHQQAAALICDHLVSVRGGALFLSNADAVRLLGWLDRAVPVPSILLAIENIIQTGENSCANLTASAVSDTSFAAWLEQIQQKHQTAAGQLSIEVGEAAAFAHPVQFQDLVKRAHGLNVTVGIEHMGYRISDIGKLGDMGMDYIKIDSLFSRDLANNPGNAALLRTYVGIAQSLGVPCIAEGINNNAELQAVYELGASGACGRGVEYRGR